MRVPLFEFDEWTCDYSPRIGHRFEHPLRGVVLVKPGSFPGQLVVQRTWARRLLNRRPEIHGPKVYGTTAGGEQGGQGIEIDPVWDPWTRDALDGVALRHDVGFFAPDGTPSFGDGKRYPLTARRLPNGFERYDGPHYIRAYRHALAQWNHDRDPFARMWLLCCWADVYRRFPLAPFVDTEGPEWSLASMGYNVTASPGLGALGITRENAWALRLGAEVLGVLRDSSVSLYAYLRMKNLHPTNTPDGSSYRALNRKWCEKFVYVLHIGQAQNGALERHSVRDGVAQEASEYVSFGGSPDDEWCTSWQTPFLLVALARAARYLPEGRTRERAEQIVERVRPWWRNVPFTAGEDDSEPGLPRYLTVAKRGKLEDFIRSGYGPARTYYDESASAAMVEIDHLHVLDRISDP